jgi:hypothetical protein
MTKLDKQIACTITFELVAVRPHVRLVVDGRGVAAENRGRGCFGHVRLGARGAECATHDLRPDEAETDGRPGGTNHTRGVLP